MKYFILLILSMVFGLFNDINAQELSAWKNCESDTIFIEYDEVKADSIHWVVQIGEMPNNFFDSVLITTYQDQGILNVTHQYVELANRIDASYWNNGIKNDTSILMYHQKSIIPGIYGEGEVLVDSKLVLTAKVNESFNESVIKFKWSFGDGDSAQSTTSQPEIEHVYKTPGNYIVKVCPFIKRHEGCAICTSREFSAIWPLNTEVIDNSSYEFDFSNGVFTTSIRDNESLMIYSIRGKLICKASGQQHISISLPKNQVIVVVKETEKSNQTLKLVTH